MKVVKFYLILLELICIISAIILIWTNISEVKCEPWMYKTLLSLLVLAAVILQREQQYIDTEDEEY